MYYVYKEGPTSMSKTIVELFTLNLVGELSKVPVGMIDVCTMV